MLGQRRTLSMNIHANDVPLLIGYKDSLFQSQKQELVEIKLL
jgi:hypothetical protein